MKKLLLLLTFAGALFAQTPGLFPWVYNVPNDGTTGTTQFKLAKLTSGNAVVTGTSDTSGYIGICVANCGTTGYALIAYAGIVPLIVDGTTTAGHYVQISSSVAGDGHDTTSYPTSGDVIGRVQTSSTGSGSTSQVLIGLEIQGFSGGGSSVTFSPPYLVSGGTSYVAATGYAATKPTSSPTWINSVTPTTTTAGTNGDYIAGGTGTYWATTTATTSVEAEFTCDSTGGNANSTACGIWVYDSTNSFIWVLISQQSSNGPEIILNKYTYSGSGNPSFSSNAATDYIVSPGVFHLKLSKSGSTLTASISINGGSNFQTVITESVGTIANAGYVANGNGSSISAYIDVYSLVIN